ncbi:IPT/TIG domain-containing protein [Nocardioides immobilis]|uniref:IPT/TIG domain-containing protein n=1 Tax=Nocardioides immobilis TaxID=2049295 RepID=UPI0011C3A2D6|nr:IPT/TIG domain-containing protein [Nocardioides immobilis]
MTDAAQNIGTATQALTVDVPGDHPLAITAISPSTGPVGGGADVLITGTGFTNVTRVKFGHAGNATSFVVVSATQIRAISPPSGTGTGRTLNITVTTPGGTSPVVAADRFTWVVSPAITAISPSTGPVGGGTDVVITGTGLTNATRVKFGHAGNATSFVVVSATQIRAISPPSGTGAGRTLNITVTTPGGTSPVVVADRFSWQ